MKACAECGETKSKTEFGKRTNSRDGLQSQCKACRSAYNAAYYAANAEKIAARYVTNRKQIIASEAAYRAKNAEKIRARKAKYYTANAETINVRSAAWRAKNIEKIRAYRVANYATNAEMTRIRCQNRRARKRASGGKLSPGLSARLLKLQRGKCACCGLPLGDDYHLDHIMPLALGGTNADDNIQLLRSKCNLQKNAKHPVDFMRQRGFLL